MNIDKKFRDQEGLKKVFEIIGENYEQKLPEGQDGQVLTKTEDGIEWQTPEKSGGG